MLRVLLVVTLLSSSPAIGGEFRAWSDFPNAEFKGTKLWRDAGSGAYCYSTTHSRVDADGAPNAYHPDDLKRTKPPFLGLDNPANAGWPKTDWWPSVLARDPARPSQPFRQTTGEFKGYFVAQTSLRVRGGDPQNPATYADSRTVPYTVLPGSVFPIKKGTGAPGDVGWAWNLANGKNTAFVIGDTGGGVNAKLGEGSLALFTALGGTNPNARTGAGVAPGRMRFVVFPGSRKALGWPATNAQITSLAGRLLENVGGAAALAACDK